MPSRILANVPAKETPPPAATAELAKTQERQIVPAAPPTAMVQAPTLKLSFGGVDFSLLPRQNSDGTVTFETMGANDAVLSLKNFTGSLRVTCGASVKPIRQDSVTPSPLMDKQQAQASTTTSPPSQRQLVAHTKAAASPALRGMTRKDSTSTSSQAPTPTVANGRPPTRRRAQVERVVAANRSSPLPYHSPVKRSRESSCPTQQQQKKTKTTPLSQQLPPSPISTTKSQSPVNSQQPRLSEPDCSQTQPSSSQVSLEGDHRTSDSEENLENVAPPPTQPSQPEEDEEIVQPSQKEKQVKAPRDAQESVATKKAQDEDELSLEEESVATKKAEDEDEESLATRTAEDDDDMVMENKDDKEASELVAPAPSQMSAAEETSEIQAASVPTTLPDSQSTSTAVTPSNRWGHSMTMVDHNRMLVYGGQGFETQKGQVVPVTMSDVHIFDLDKQKWFQPIQCDDKTRQHPRQWATSTYIPQRQLLVVFGGESMNPKTGRVVTSDKNNLMVLDTEILLWYPPSVSGDLPSGRSGHTGTLLPSSANSELVIFGGVKASKHLSTVSVLDTKAWRWSSPRVQGIAPKARSYHTATAIRATHCGSVNGVGGHQKDHISNSKDATISIRQRIVIFGGNDHTESFNTVHVLEKTEGPTCSWRWFHPTVSGTPPKARTGHSATLLADQKTICIYGGWDPIEDDDSQRQSGDDSTLFFEDSFLLDTDSWTWKEGPKAAFAGHSLDASQGTNGGARRSGHCAVLNTNNTSANEVMVFGGRIPGDEFCGDFQTLTVPR